MLISKEKQERYYQLNAAINRGERISPEDYKFVSAWRRAMRSYVRRRIKWNNKTHDRCCESYNTVR